MQLKGRDVQFEYSLPTSPQLTVSVLRQLGSLYFACHQIQSPAALTQSTASRHQLQKTHDDHSYTRIHIGIRQPLLNSKSTRRSSKSNKRKRKREDGGERRGKDQRTSFETRVPPSTMHLFSDRETNPDTRNSFPSLTPGSSSPSSSSFPSLISDLHSLVRSLNSSAHKDPFREYGYRFTIFS